MFYSGKQLHSEDVDGRRSYDEEKSETVDDYGDIRPWIRRNESEASLLKKIHGDTLRVEDINRKCCGIDDVHKANDTRRKTEAREDGDIEHALKEEAECSVVDHPLRF